MFKQWITIILTLSFVWNLAICENRESVKSSTIILASEVISPPSYIQQSMDGAHIKQQVIERLPPRLYITFPQQKQKPIFDWNRGKRGNWVNLSGLIVLSVSSFSLLYSRGLGEILLCLATLYTALDLFMRIFVRRSNQSPAGPTLLKIEKTVQELWKTFKKMTLKDRLIQSAIPHAHGVRLELDFQNVGTGGKDLATKEILVHPRMVRWKHSIYYIMIRRSLGFQYNYTVQKIHTKLGFPSDKSIVSRIFWVSYGDYECLKRIRFYLAMTPYALGCFAFFRNRNADTFRSQSSCHLNQPTIQLSYCLRNGSRVLSPIAIGSSYTDVQT